MVTDISSNDNSMYFGSFVTSQIGMVHFLASMLAVVLGTCVLVIRKGTTNHKIIGRLYGLSMFVVLATAFMMYRLFGTWGIFHWAALFSTITLVVGLVPIILKRPKGYIPLHFSFMYWSVIGVYSALVSETLVRIPVTVENGIPNLVFYSMTGIGTVLVLGTGLYFFIRLRPNWGKIAREREIGVEK